MRDLILLFTLAIAGPAAAQQNVFADFERRCEADGKRLWGRSLCAPIVIVDPDTGAFTTSRAAPAALPATRANTAIRWAGEDWIMVLGPLPTSEAERASLFFHEAWHVQQEALGFSSNAAVASHLSATTARYLIRLEWAALAQALKARGALRRGHVAQALALRRQRLRDEVVARAERDQMRHEGLAAYTGTVLSGAPLRVALASIESGATRPSLSRSFAYASGPAWGLLLDDLAPAWRAKLASGKDLPELAPVAPARVAFPDRYGGTALLLEETRAGIERDAQLAADLAATAEDKALRLPLAQIALDFDPDQVVAVPDGSSIYRKITLSDHWGRIQLDGIPLRITSDFSAAFAPWPLPVNSLELALGWTTKEHDSGGASAVRRR